MHNIFSRGCTVQVTYLLFRISNYLSVRMLSRYSRHIQNCLVRILVPGPGEFHLEKNVNEMSEHLHVYRTRTLDVLKFGSDIKIIKFIDLL